MTCTLSDGSHSPVTVNVPVSAYGNTVGYIEFTLNAASAGQTATVTGLAENNDHSAGAGSGFLGATLT